MMSIVPFATIGLLAGILLGRRLKVLALVPLELAALVLTGLSVTGGWASLYTGILAFLGFSIGLQGGYASALIMGVMPAPPVSAATFRG